MFQNLSCFLLDSLRFCGQPRDGIGESLQFVVEGHGCTKLYYEDGEVLTNPPVFYDGSTKPDAVILELDGVLVKRLSEEEIYVKEELDHPNCELIPEQHFDDRINVIATYKGQYYIFDPQILFHGNDVDEPLKDGGGLVMAQTRLTRDQYINNMRHEVMCR